MMRSWTLFGVWALVLVATTTLTWQIVSAADYRVSDRPVAPLNVVAPETVADVGTGILPGAASPTTLPEPTPTTSGGPRPTAPTTTTVAATTETTSGETTATTEGHEDEWQFKTVETNGGSVTVSYRPGEVVFETASPEPGFRVEVEKAGPPEVEVEFESDDLKIEVRVKWSDGELEIRVTESEKGEGDGDNED
jgi:hypothetical protein